MDKDKIEKNRKSPTKTDLQKKSIVYASKILNTEAIAKMYGLKPVDVEVILDQIYFKDKKPN